MRTWIASTVVVAVFASCASVAMAQDPAPVAPEKSAAEGGPYHSDKRQMCEQELEKDAGWRAELKNSLRPEVHQEDANLMVTNKRHVVMAYIAIWVLTVVFLVLMWVRQQRLLVEIASLKQDLDKALSED